VFSAGAENNKGENSRMMFFPLTLFIYLAVCTMFPHLPAPVWQL